MLKSCSFKCKVDHKLLYLLLISKLIFTSAECSLNDIKLTGREVPPSSSFEG